MAETDLVARQKLPHKSGNIAGGECIIIQIRNSKCYTSEQTYHCLMFVTTVEYMAPPAANPLSANKISEMQVGPVCPNSCTIPPKYSKICGLTVLILARHE
jgi:hypothetical protein